MKERFMSLAEVLMYQLHFGTFYAVFLRYCVTHIIIQNSIITRDLQYNFIVTAYKFLNLNIQMKMKRVNSILSQISKVKNECLNIDEYISVQPVLVKHSDNI